jgi:bifunctional non-homologous end joining protein LigD
MLLDPAKVTGARKTTQVPRFVPPELATLVQKAPRGGDWSHEVKFDGYRAIARIENGVSEIRSRNDKDWTEAFQVLAAELAKLPVKNAIVDGEVVVQSPDGKTSFEALRHVARGVDGAAPRRGGAGGAEKADRRAEATSRLVYYAFDLLFLNGYDLLDVPLEERRALLRQLLGQGTSGGWIKLSDGIPGDGPAVLEQACSLGLEGVVSKRSTSRYRPGVRGTEWVKTKCRHEQEFVIGGFTDPRGGREGFGALILGVNGDRGLRYVSKVGTGFDDRLLRDLGRRVRALEIDVPPFVENLPRDRTGMHWVRPELVAQVSFMEWTSSGGIRHAVFKGLREDKPTDEVFAERAVVPPARSDRS